MARKKKEEEEVNHERWLVSYADFITLLFAFFTTLYAISTVDAHKMGQMVLSMQKSFDAGMFASGSSFLSLDQGPSGNGDTLSNDLLNKIKLQEGFEIREAIMTKSGMSGNVISSRKEMEKLKNRINSRLSASKLKASVSMRVDSRGLVLSLGEGGFFDSGSEVIKPDGRILLDTLAESLVPLGNNIRIEGHTDTDPINNSKFDSNWELSEARATGILRYLIGKFDFKPELLSTAGYSQYRPVAPNDSPEGKARNRRVDIVILLDSVAAREEPNGILEAAQNQQ